MQYFIVFFLSIVCGERKICDGLDLCSQLRRKTSKVVRITLFGTKRNVIGAHTRMNAVVGVFYIGL